MTAKVLCTSGTLSSSLAKHFTNAGLDLILAPTDLSEIDLIRCLEGCDAYLLAGVEKVTPLVLSSCRGKLKIIAFMGTGYHSFIDVNAAALAGIAVSNAPGANAKSVAEFALGLTLDAVRRITESSNKVKLGNWSDVMTKSLSGSKIGIIGCGRIGSEYAKIVKNAFGSDIQYYSRSRKFEIESKFDAKFLDLHTLLSTSDIISLHVSYSDNSKNLLDFNEFNVIKQGCVVVCTARPETMNSLALRSSLLDGRVSFLAMDGYYIEPCPTIDQDQFGLLSLPQVIITPHMASLSEDSVENMICMNVNSIKNYLLNGNDVLVVNNPLQV